MQMEPFQERQTLKVRKQEAIGQCYCFFFCGEDGVGNFRPPLLLISTVGMLMLQLQVIVYFL